MTSPADELRTAATKLRELATAATPGPWATDTSIPYGHRVGSSNAGADWVARTGEHGQTGSESDASYIAAMGPNVGTALADWLDSWTGIDLYEAGPLPEDARHALAVARAINGTQEATS
jgi:hypothetical protein